MTYDEVVAIALAKPGTAESTHYGYLAVKRDKKFMFGLRHPDEELACFKLDWDAHDRILVEYPDVAYKIPHFDGYPAFLVRLPLLGPGLARELVDLSYESSPKKPVSRPRGGL